MTRPLHFLLHFHFHFHFQAPAGPTWTRPATDSAVAFAAFHAAAAAAEQNKLLNERCARSRKLRLMIDKVAAIGALRAAAGGGERPVSHISILAPWILRLEGLQLGG